jgi:hypothetical protein
MVMTFANGNVTSKVYGCEGNDLRPRLELLADERPVNGVYQVNNVAIQVGLATDDMQEYPMGAILAFKDDTGLKVSTSYMLGLIRSVGTTPLRNVAAPYMEGRAYYDIVMEEYGYTEGSVLEANVPIDTSGDEAAEEEGDDEEE